MKRILSTTVLLLLIAATVLGQEIETKNYNFSNYDKIKVSNSLNVRLIADNSEGVSVTCDNRLLPAMRVKQSGSKVSISIDWDKVKKIVKSRKVSKVNIDEDIVIINDYEFKGGIIIKVNVKNISELEAVSAGGIIWDNNLPTKNLRLMASSAGSIKWQSLLKLDKLYIDCSSAGNLSGDINTKTAVVNLSSAGNYNGNINSETLEADISSAANFRSEIDAKKATFQLNSAANAKVWGNIDDLFVEASSISKFRGRQIVYKYAEVETSSMSSIYLSKSGKVVDNTAQKHGIFIE